MVPHLQQNCICIQIKHSKMKFVIVFNYGISCQGYGCSSHDMHTYLTDLNKGVKHLLSGQLKLPIWDTSYCDDLGLHGEFLFTTCTDLTVVKAFHNPYHLDSTEHVRKNQEFQDFCTKFCTMILGKDKTFSTSWVVKNENSTMLSI